jgi:hypothetical protein
MCSQYTPTPAVSSILRTKQAASSSYSFSFANNAAFSALGTAQSAVYEISVDIYNDTDSEVLVTFTYDTPELYVARNTVNDIRIEAID